MQAFAVAGKRYRHHALMHGPVGPALRPGQPGRVPVVLLHGFLGDMFSWQYCVVPLSRHGQVFALDLPGHGKACEVTVDGLDAMAAWLEDALDALDLDCCHLVAHSFGAWVALQGALRLQQRVRSLSLVSCAGLDRHFNFPLLGAALAVDDEPGAVRYAEALLGQSGETAKLLARRHLALVTDIQRRLALQRMLDEMVESVSSARLAPIEWSLLHAPMKFFWSRNDTIVPLPPMEVFPPDVDLCINEQGGHVPHIVTPGWLNDGIGSFLISSQASSA